MKTQYYLEDSTSVPHIETLTSFYIIDNKVQNKRLTSEILY